MHPRPHFTLSIGRRKLPLGERTIVMGIVNVTPDSFSDGGLYLDRDKAIAHAVELARQGADWIDVGGESTRPGSKPVTAEEELRRVLPVIKGLAEALGSFGPRKGERQVEISIDTSKSEVAEAAVRAGATVLNDISGLRFDPRLGEVARHYGLPLVLMHMRGRPETMQQGPFARSIWRSLGAGLGASLRAALRAGVRRSQIILDPGLGFGKTRRQNFEILAGLERLRSFRLPLLVGASRKSFIRAVMGGEPLDLPLRPSMPPQSLAATAIGLSTGDAAAVVAAILGGAHIVRVHDVAATQPAIRIADAVLEAL